MSVGPGVYLEPRFPGAQSSRTLGFPFIDAEYDNRYYTSASDLVGLYGVKSDTTQAGVALQWDPTRRKAQDDARLRGLPDVKETARFKVFASRTLAFITLDGNLASDVLGRGEGTLAQTNLWLTAPLAASLSVSMGPGITWADTRYMRSFFTVSAAEAAASPHLSAYDAHAGLSDAHINALAEWVIRTHYRVGVLASIAHLRGNAETSPIAAQRAQHTMLGWIAYKFR